MLDGGGWSSRHGRFTPGKRTGPLCVGSWVGPRAGLDGLKTLAPTRIRSPDRRAHSYPGPHTNSATQLQIMAQSTPQSALFYIKTSAATELPAGGCRSFALYPPCKRRTSILLPFFISAMLISSLLLSVLKPFFVFHVLLYETPLIGCNCDSSKADGQVSVIVCVPTCVISLNSCTRCRSDL